MRYRLLLTVSLLLCTSCAATDQVNAPERVSAAPVSARQLKSVQLHTLKGERLALPAETNRPVCVHLWATWCGPCRSELPELAAVAKEFDDSILFYFVAVSDDAERVRRFAIRHKITSEVILDPDAILPQSLRSYGVPLTFCVDSGGYFLELTDPESPYLQQLVLTGARSWDSNAGRALFHSVAISQ